MGYRYRKSFKAGPFRLNVSKKGLGWSVGNKYARTTFTAPGKVRQTYTLPGTGISHVEEHKLQSSKPRSRGTGQTAAHRHVFCTGCGQAIGTGDRFCTSCGAPVVDLPAVQQGGKPRFRREWYTAAWIICLIVVFIFALAAVGAVSRTETLQGILYGGIAVLFLVLAIASRGKSKSED